MARLAQPVCMPDQPFEPRQFVIELRSRLRIAVRKIQAGDQNTGHRRLQIPACGVARIPGQPAPHFNRRLALGQNRDAIPTPLSVPDPLVPGLLEGHGRERGILRLELLQAHDIRRLFLQPLKQVRQPARDAVDVECRELQRFGSGTTHLKDSTRCDPAAAGRTRVPRLEITNEQAAAARQAAADAMATRRNDDP